MAPKLIALACICLIAWQMERGDLDKNNVFRKMSFDQALTTGSLVGMTRKETALLLPETEKFFDNGSAGEIHVLWQEPADCSRCAYDMTEGVVFEYDSNQRVKGWHVSQQDWHYHGMCKGFSTGPPFFTRRKLEARFWRALCSVVLIWRAVCT